MMASRRHREPCFDGLGRSRDMKKLWILLGFGFSLGMVPLMAAPILGNIKIDHFGYRTGDTKIAYCTANPGTSIEVHDANTNALILTTTSVTDKGNDTSSPLMSGDHVWWVDFSALAAPGPYYLYSPSL